MFLDYTHPDYHFYSYTAPRDPRLPGGGGYRVTGLNTRNNAQSATGPQVQTFMEERRSTWHGIDTNFVWRGPGGLRLNGGTSSGYSNLNTCYAELDNPDTPGKGWRLPGRLRRRESMEHAHQRFRLLRHPVGRCPHERSLPGIPWGGALGQRAGRPQEPGDLGAGQRVPAERSVHGRRCGGGHRLLRCETATRRHRTSTCSPQRALRRTHHAVRPQAREEYPVRRSPR